jgi:aspartate kinase
LGAGRKGLIVVKFGGTSLADAERMRRAASIVDSRAGTNSVVVVSALAGVTDRLSRAFELAADNDLEGVESNLADIERRHRWALSGTIEDGTRRHHVGLSLDREFDALRSCLRSIRVLGEGTPKVRDEVLAFGERLSALLVAAAFTEYGLATQVVDPREVIATDSRFGRAIPDLERTRLQAAPLIATVLKQGRIPILGGFVGADEAGNTTTLGRGGSDSSAAIVALACDAVEVQIWTDVDGLMTADPRLVPEARRLERVTFAAAAELALYGARVLHPDSIAPAVHRRIPVRILNSAEPECEGTLIVDEREAESATAGRPLAVTSRSGVSCLQFVAQRLPLSLSVSREVIRRCEELDVRPDLWFQSATHLTLVAESGEALSRLADSVEGLESRQLHDVALVGVVGAGESASPELRAVVLAELGRSGAELIVSSISGATALAVLPAERLVESVRLLHDRFLQED